MMTEDRIFLEFGADDYIVKLSPFKDSNGNWTGELLVGTVVTEDNLMSDEDHYNLMNITKMVCAAVPGMEEDEYIRNMLTSIAERVEAEEKEPEKPKIQSVEENVISVNFK